MGEQLQFEDGDRTIDSVLRAMRDNGAQRIFMKEMAENDNSKNQYYIGGDAVLKALRIDLANGILSKEGKGTAIRTAHPIEWMDDDGRLVLAPNAGVCFYPKYPEARLSGLMFGVPRGFGGRDLVGPRMRDRVMLLGVGVRGLIVWVGRLREEFARLRTRPLEEAKGAKVPITEVVIDRTTADIWAEALRLAEVLGTGLPVPARRFTTKGILPYNIKANNAGGMTLEAHYRVVSNSNDEPDFGGLIELKVVSDSPLTLMTPEPKFGIYVDPGKTEFMARYAKPPKPNAKKQYFNGNHRLDKSLATNALTLRVDGWSPSAPGKFAASSGRLFLEAVDGTVAAGWWLRDLHAHWLKKHDNVLFVRYSKDKAVGLIDFHGPAYVAKETDFGTFMTAVHKGSVYLDPGTHMVLATGKFHVRNQWRSKQDHLRDLYRSFSEHPIRL